MTFKTLLVVTGPNQGEGDLKLAADLCEQIDAHLSVIVLELAAPPSGGEYAAVVSALARGASGRAEKAQGTNFGRRRVSFPERRIG